MPIVNPYTPGAGYFEGEPIDSFENQYAFLSNFWKTQVVWFQWVCPTNEHAFQLAKFSDPTQQKKVALAPDPSTAKRYGRQKHPSYRSDWEDIKILVMLLLVRQKFTTHHPLEEWLMATGSRELIEGNTWKDTTWGMYGGKGSNFLGRILMIVRDEIRFLHGLSPVLPPSFTLDITSHLQDPVIPQLELPL